MKDKQEIDDFPITEINLEPLPTKEALPKKKRGRPKGSKNKVQSPKSNVTIEPNSPNEVDFDLLENKAEVSDIITTNSIKYCFNILAVVSKNDVWKISDKEAKEIYTAFANAIAKLPKSKLNKYKKYFDNYTPFIQLVIVLGAVIYPRYVITQESKAIDEYKSNGLEQAISEFERVSERQGNQSNINAETTNSNDSSGNAEGNSPTLNDWIKGYGN